MEGAINENFSTAVDFAHDEEFDEELDPPPYSPHPCSPPPYSYPSAYLQVQVGKECILSVEEGFITLVEGKIRIRPWEGNSLSQKWKIESKIKSGYSRFGFRNQSSDKLLGVQSFNGNVVARNRKLKHWELFCLDAIAGGFVFRIPARLMRIEVFLVQPFSTDRLQASGRRNRNGIVYIHYTNWWEIPCREMKNPISEK